jgi:hypothetical protein
VAATRDATDMTEHDQLVLRSMVDSYERARAEQQDFLDRLGTADRTRAIGRPRRRRVRVATSADAEQRPSHQL